MIKTSTLGEVNQDLFKSAFEQVSVLSNERERSKRYESIKNAKTSKNVLEKDKSSYAVKRHLIALMRL
ncbi:hypothetical protein AAUPMG_12456 [Pasteurella multocida subsp. multocida str. Anand1_goat]|nr:hypothetical protein AAUPMG_12456 [Pasteurella multocida subsp. multocida str. Anand1_goat]